MENIRQHVRHIAMFALLAASVILLPQRAMADTETYDVLPEGGLERQEAQVLEDDIAAYSMEGTDYSGSEYELYTTLENRIKEAMLADQKTIDISDLKVRRDQYDLALFYCYSPYFYPGRYSFSVWRNNTYYDNIELEDPENAEETKERFRAIDKKLASIYKLVDNSMTEEQKALVIYDYLEVQSAGDPSYRKENGTSYAIIMNGIGYCQSYAGAYMYLMNHLGIETHFWASDRMNHVWNVIKIDGEYYNVDCTYDDALECNYEIRYDRYGQARHQYFLKTNKEMRALGHRFRTEPYECTSTRYSDAYWKNAASPICFWNGKAYFVGTMGMLQSYDLASGEMDTVLNRTRLTRTLEKKGNLLYFSNGTTIYTYSLETGEEEMVYEEPHDSMEMIMGVRGKGKNLEYQTYDYDGGTFQNYEIELDGESTPDGWYQEESDWYYYKDGECVTGWKWIGKSWYLFDDAGIMKTGWQKDGKNWYYLNKSGAMQKGWQKIGGKWYYLNESGVMKTGWQKIGGKWYYLNGSGAMQTGWQKIGGKWYYMNGSGAMQTGWQKIGGKWYYLDQNGVMQTSKWISGTYYVKADGTMAISEWVDQNRYYVDASGKWVKNK